MAWDATLGSPARIFAITVPKDPLNFRRCGEAIASRCRQADMARCEDGCVSMW